MRMNRRMRAKGCFARTVENGGDENSSEPGLLVKVHIIRNPWSVGIVGPHPWLRVGHGSGGSFPPEDGMELGRGWGFNVQGWRKILGLGEKGEASIKKTANLLFPLEQAGKAGKAEVSAHSTCS